jgi:hypothetical protein
MTWQTKKRVEDIQDIKKREKELFTSSDEMVKRLKKGGLK